MAMRSLAPSALVFLLTAGAAAAADTADAPILEVPILEVPFDCRLGALCVVQNYVDQDPGPGARDHACGPLSYDGHQGTDIRVAAEHATFAVAEVRWGLFPGGGTTVRQPRQIPYCMAMELLLVGGSGGRFSGGPM